MSESSSSQEMTTVVDGLGKVPENQSIKIISPASAGFVLFYFIGLSWDLFYGSPTRRLGPWKHMITAFARR
jgi:hypothetical protein